MIHGSDETKRRARKLRREMSWPEVILWSRLRQRPGGFKFRRQHPAGRYVLDFYCHEARLAIEVDGTAHDMGDAPERDGWRDAWLGQAGVTVLRLAAGDVQRDANGAVEAIVARCSQRGNPLHRPAGGPPPRAGEESLTPP